MMFKRSETVCKLECINKLVVVSHQFQKICFLKISLLSLFMNTSFFGNLSHFIGFFVSPHADQLGKSYVSLTKV